MSVLYPSPHKTWIRLSGNGPGYDVLTPLATINTAGSGYTNGDIVYLPSFTTVASIPTTGYPYPNPASFQLTVVDGKVTTATCYDSGNYPWSPNGIGQSLPGPMNAEKAESEGVSVTGGTGSGLTLNVTWPNASYAHTIPPGCTLNDLAMWFAENIDGCVIDQSNRFTVLCSAISGIKICHYFNFYNTSVPVPELVAWCVNHLTATIVDPGSGYSNCDCVTLIGGTLNPVPPELEGGSVSPSVFMLTVTDGVVTDATLVIGGSYSSLPSNPVSVTGGTGAGLTLNLVSDPIDPEIMYLHYYAPATVKLGSNSNSGTWTAIVPGVGGTYPTCTFSVGVTTEGYTGTLTIMDFDSTGKTIAFQGDGGYQFQPHDIGTQIIVTSGTGFTPGTYTIEDTIWHFGYSVDGNSMANGFAIVDRSMGKPGSTKGLGSITLSAPMGGIVPIVYWSPQPGITCLTNSRVLMNLNNSYYRTWTSVNFTWHMLQEGYRGAYLDQGNMGGEPWEWQNSTGFGTVVLTDMQAFTEYPTGKVSSSGTWVVEDGRATLTDVTQNWATDEWQECLVQDAAGHIFTINSNTNNQLRVVGSPVGSNYNLGGIIAGNILWNYDNLECYKLNYARYMAAGLTTFWSNWGVAVSYPTLPYVTSIFEEFGLYYMGAITGQPGPNEIYPAIQMAGKNNAPSAVDLHVIAPPTAQLCFPGYVFLDNIISYLAKYYVVFNYTDYFDNEDGGDPIPYYNIGAFNYNVGAPISSGQTPYIDVLGPTAYYLFDRGIDSSSLLYDSGTGSWARQLNGDYVLTDSTKNWVTNQWKINLIKDGAGSIWTVDTNTATTLTVNASQITDSIYPSDGNTGNYQMGTWTYSVYARQYENALTFFKDSVAWPFSNPWGITIASASIENIGSGYTDLDVINVANYDNYYGSNPQFQIKVVDGNVVGFYYWSLDITTLNAGSGITNASGIYQVEGGTSYTPAELNLTISNGKVTAVKISTAGVYSVLPTNPVSVSGLTATTQPSFDYVPDLTWGSANGGRTGNYNSLPTNPVNTTGGTGSGLTLNLMPHLCVAGATIVDSGSGYTNLDVVSIVGGVVGGIVTTIGIATFILTVSDGVVTTATLQSSGKYSQFPTNPVSVSGGHGTGLTLNLTSIVHSSFTTYTLPTSPTGNWYFLNADFNGTVSNTTPITEISLPPGAGAILVTSPTSPDVTASMSTFPFTIPVNHAGNITLNVTGIATSWTDSTVFSISGLDDATLISQSVQGNTQATVVVTTGVTTGTLTLTDGTVSYPIAVITSTLDVSYNVLSRFTSYGGSISLSTNCAVWAQEDLDTLFSITIGDGSLTTPINVSNCYCWVSLTASTPVTIKDNSTGAVTASFTFPTGLSGLVDIFINTITANSSLNNPTLPGISHSVHINLTQIQLNSSLKNLVLRISGVSNLVNINVVQIQINSDLGEPTLAIAGIGTVDINVSTITISSYWNDPIYTVGITESIDISVQTITTNSTWNDPILGTTGNWVYNTGNTLASAVLGNITFNSNSSPSIVYISQFDSNDLNFYSLLNSLPVGTWISCYQPASKAFFVLQLTSISYSPNNDAFTIVDSSPSSGGTFIAGDEIIITFGIMAGVTTALPLLRVYDRVKETTITGGTSDITLNGAVFGFQSFASTVGVGNQTYYGIVDNYNGVWEIGIGTLVDPVTLSRDFVYSSSSSGELINFANSIKFVILSIPAEVWTGSLLFSELPTQIITSPTYQIIVDDGVPVTPLVTTSLSNVTLTSLPTIAGTPRNGQLVILRNDNPIREASITFTDTNFLQGSGIRLSYGYLSPSGSWVSCLPNGTLAMAGNSVLELIYTTTSGTGPGWIENSYMEILINEGNITSFTINVGFGAYNSQYLEVANAPWPIPDPTNSADLGSQYRPTFAWTYSGTPTGGTVSSSGINGEGEETGYPATLIAPYLTLIGPPVDKGTSVGATETFTPHITVSGPVRTTPTASLTYINRRYIGLENYTTQLSDATINGFTNAIANSSPLSLTQYATWVTVDATAGTYVWICLRSALEMPYFAIINTFGLLDPNGSPNVRAGFSPADNNLPAYASVDHTNASGFTEPYDQWRSYLAGMGTVTIVTQSTPASNFRYYFANAITGFLSDDVINAATVLDLDVDIPVTETIDGSTGYVYMVYPTRLTGPSYIQVNDYIAGTIVEGTGGVDGEPDHRNIYGYLESYVQFSTNTAGLGNTGYTFTNTIPNNKFYAGSLSQNTTLLTSAEVVALKDTGSSTPTPTVYNTFTVDASSSTYSWYAYPTRYTGSVYFGVLIPLLGDNAYQWANFNLVGTQSVTNEQGYTENFYEYAATTYDWEADLIGVSPQTISVGSVAFNNRIYMGPSPYAASLGLLSDDLSDYILDIINYEPGMPGYQTNGVSSTQLLATLFDSTYIINVNVGYYLWFCHPVRLGTLSTIIDNVTGFGLAGGYINTDGSTYPTKTLATISHTNNTGYTEEYYLWISDNPGIYPITDYPTGRQININYPR